MMLTTTIQLTPCHKWSSLSKSNNALVTILDKYDGLLITRYKYIFAVKDVFLLYRDHYPSTCRSIIKYDDPALTV